MASCSPAAGFRGLAEEASPGLSADSARLSRTVDRKRRPNWQRSWIGLQENHFQRRQLSFSKPDRGPPQGFGSGPPGSFATETACSPRGKVERCCPGGWASARSRAARPGARQGASRQRHPRRGQLPQNPEEFESANVRRDCGKVTFPVTLGLLSSFVLNGSLCSLPLQGGGEGRASAANRGRRRSLSLIRRIPAQVWLRTVRFTVARCSFLRSRPA